MRCLARGEIPGCFLSTFNVPNLNYCIPMWRNDGNAIGQYWAGTVPNIFGGIHDALSQTADGVFFKNSGTYKTNAGTSLTSAAWFSYIGFDASRSSPVYDNNNTGQVYAANLKMYMCIKY